MIDPVNALALWFFLGIMVWACGFAVFHLRKDC